MFENPRGKRRLKEIHVKEVSLVDNPASRKRFFFFKRGVLEMDEELKKAIEEFMGQELEKAELKPEAITELKAALKTLNQYKSELPDDLVDAISNLAKFLASAAKPSDGYGYPEKKGIENTMDDKGKEIESVVEKAIAVIDSNSVGAKKELRELLPENVKKDAEDDEKWDKLMSGIEDIKGRLTILEAGKSESKEEEKEEDKEKKEKDEEEPITDVMKAVALLAKATTKNAEAVEKLRKTVAPKKSKDEETKLKKVEEDLWKSIDL